MTPPTHVEASGLSPQSALTTVLVLAAGGLFILALKWLSSPVTARKGNAAGQIGMACAVVAALLGHDVLRFEWIVLGVAVGTVIGVPMAVWMPMTAVPQRTALSHAFGALAATLVGAAHYRLFFIPGALVPHPVALGFLAVEVLLGALTFTGSLMAFGKLQEILPGRPIVYRGQNTVNLIVLVLAVAAGVALVLHPEQTWLFVALVSLASLFGVFLILPIGGADMPTVIALLNSYAGLSASMMGFVLDNRLLVIAGALDGASGLILSIVMCRAMNRSFTNVLFGAFGQAQATSGTVEQRTAKTCSAEEAAEILGAASSVVIIPGYGMAVAQAQHKVREIFDQLTKRGVDVRFAIHPVAGRMPGHMNVLLAEAEIPYDRLVEMDDINGDMPQCDVALVIGANDVVNPAARSDKSSPIYGMPIIDADKAKTVMAIKRSMNVGFAGIENQLYFADNCMMLFGDAKSVVSSIGKELAESGRE